MRPYEKGQTYKYPLLWGKGYERGTVLSGPFFLFRALMYRRKASPLSTEKTLRNHKWQASRIFASFAPSTIYWGGLLTDTGNRAGGHSGFAPPLVCALDSITLALSPI